MSREDINFVVEILQTFNEFTSYECRQKIYILWETFFTNTVKVAQSLKENQDKSECCTILQWFLILTKNRSEVFLATPQHQGDETPVLSQVRTDSEEEKISFEFSRWFMCTLIGFLSEVEFEATYQNLCIDIIKQLFLILKWRNGYFYCTMLTEIVHIIADLVKANDRLYESNNHYSVDLKRFVVDLQTVNSSLVPPDKREEGIPQTIKSQVTLTINSIKICECLQLNAVKILQLASDDVSHVIAKSTCHVAWGSMCCHVEMGDLVIKKESLTVLDRLLIHSGLPTLDITKYFLSCVTALIELLCSGCEGGNKSEIIDLEEKTSQLIDNLIKADQKELNQNHLSISQIQHMLQQMTVVIVTYQMKKLATINMKNSVMKLIVHCINRLNSSQLQGTVLKPVMESLTTALIKILGTSDNCQYLVAPLVKLVLIEMGTVNVKIESTPEQETSATQGSSKLALSQFKRKRKLDMDEKPKRRKVPKTLRLLCQKIQIQINQLDKPLNQELAIPLLEGIQVGLETVLTCYNLCVCQDKTKTDFSYQVTEDMQSIDWWIQQKMLQQLNEGCIQSIVVKCNQWQQSAVTSCLFNILAICSNFLRLKDTCDLVTEMLQNFLWILSLPWLPNDPSWYDLKPDHAKEIANVARNLSDKIELSVKCRLLEGLALFPKDMSPKWRVHVFKQAFSDTDWQIRNTAITSFPTLLLHLGPNANHLVHDLISPVIDDKSREVQLSLANNVGILACVVCRKAVLRYKSDELKNPFYESFEIQCLSCDNLKDEQSNNASKSRPNLVDPNMFVPYLTLLSSDDTTIKKSIIGSLKRMFGHIGVRAKSSTIVSMLDTALNVLVDPDYNIRVSFSKVVPYLVGENCNETNQRIVTKLKEAYYAACMEQNIRLQETIVLTLAQFGRIAENEQLLVVILNLLESMISPIPLIAAVAFEQLKYVAQYKKMKTQDLFMRSRLPICKFLAEAMHQKMLSCNDADAATDILKDVTKVLDFPDDKRFLQSANKFIVPHLVSIATPEASNLLKKISVLVDLPNRKKIMMENIKYIFPYIAIYFQEAEQGKAMKFLQKETAFDMEQLLRCQFQTTHNELLLHLGTHYQKVFSGLTVLSKCVKTQGYEEPQTMTSAEMADYLQPKLLGVIGFFDLQLLNNNIPLEDKKMTLESLTAIIRLMGRKHIGMIRYKIVNTLRIGLQITDRDIQEISCKAWDCFVKSLETPFLGQMMSQIIATLLPLLNSLPKQVSELFNFMIVENRETLSVHFHEVYFLPDIPELSVANDILKQYTEGSSSQSDLRTRLDHSMKGITHESLDVRLHALSKLKNLLRDEKEALYQFVIGNETADPIVSKIVSVLLSGSRDSDSRAQILYAECIGELGAIDPGRLELTTNDPKADNAKFHHNICEDNFAFDLINQVVKGFLAATETRIQDGTALALQELLKIFKITETSKLWKRFADHVKEILLPLFTTKYTLTSQQDWSKITKPIFLSEKSKTFAEWVSTWTGYLLSKVKQDHARSVFVSCTAAIKNDVHIALYILPYAVTQVLQDGSPHDIKEVFTEILEVISHTQKPDTKHRDGNFHHMSAQTIFSIMDHLTKWKRQKAQTSGIIPGKGPAYLSDSGYRAIDSFLNKIPQDLLAQACFSCGAYTRALMHFEQFLSSKNQNVQDHLDFLQRLYVAMDESDGVIGVAAIRQTQPTLIEQILIHESLGQHQDAQACYEKAIDSEVDSVEHHKGLLQSLMELGQQNKALLHATGAIAERPEWAPHIRSYMVEAAWKLGNWDKLEKCIKSEKTGRNWAVGVGELLLSAKAKNEEKFMKHLQIVRREQIGPLSAASMESGSYQRGYQHIVRLHLLTEIEECFRVLADLKTEVGGTGDGPRISTQELLKNWDRRLQVMQWSFRAQEPLLTLRRTLFNLAQQMTGHDVDHEIGHWWLWSAKIARKEGYNQTAYSSLLQAGDYNLPEVFVEKAKWFWSKGDKDQALTCLERGMSVHFPDIQALKSDTTDQSKARLKIYAQALLLFGRYSDEASSLESNSILRKYREVIDIYNDWEEGHFYLAQYYDKIMTTLFEENTAKGDFIYHVIRNFGQSLLHGNQYIYQSMPRLLSLWLEYGTQVADYEKQDKQKPQISQRLQTMRNTLGKLNRLISNFGRELAPYQLFTAYPQLISRICHAQSDVFQHLKDIVARIFVHFPKQSLWMMMAVSKSSYSMRVKRCQDIFAEAKSRNSELKKFIEDGTKLTERLLELCNKDFKNALTISVTQHFRPLKRLLEDSNFSKILVPLQSSMTVTLPNTPGLHQDHNPFPCNEVFIKGFEDTIEVLPSLQRPKKITLTGSDGKLYIMMCKPKDDLRKDCRLMEFNGIINKFLHKDPDSRRRQLHIRTYSVIPLNEECGLIEWVNNTNGLRNILLKYYRERGCGMTGKELKDACPSKQSSLETKLQVLKEKLLPRHPPVFKEWFLRTFQDPTSWYNARVSYARTAAVMSMVGYILGLGDRHGENILFDSTNGDCVHVDFNCLFNKGTTFEWPERVPFRLTHNMIDAMGPMGYEGIFRKASEVTLRVMRTQMDPLMSVLKPFIYDPLVEWSKPVKPQGQRSALVPGQRSIVIDTGEINNEQAMKHVQDIEDRLKGILKNEPKQGGQAKPKSVALSIEGHVNHLINDATDEKNQCQMYIGWAAYL
ncbi:serine/threonine-protein kinase ATR-like [Mytilus trossulus]|uniref:serine/threonine-protein kinase ATR-like n=1 Tax=Mytilus trossulus TaxID=6551 RepID=UPI0030042982